MNEQSKSLLVVKTPGPMADGQAQRLKLMLEPLCQEIGAKMVVTDGGTDVALYQDLGPLCQQLGALIDAMAKQHSVFGRLVASNEALVQAIADAEGSGEGNVSPPPARGLNGRPL